MYSSTPQREDIAMDLNDIWESTWLKAGLLAAALIAAVFTALVVEL